MFLKCTQKFVKLYLYEKKSKPKVLMIKNSSKKLFKAKENNFYSIYWHNKKF